MPTTPDGREIKFVCCYCGRAMDDETPDFVGVSIYDPETGESRQCWFAHELCFRQTLDPNFDVKSDYSEEWDDAEA